MKKIISLNIEKNLVEKLDVLRGGCSRSFVVNEILNERLLGSNPNDEKVGNES